MSEPIEAADFYTGLIAELYGHLRSEISDPAPYERFITRSGEPALELGCGDGHPMLELRARGLDVEGLDSSADMLERFRRAAVARNLDVTLHHATFQAMGLGQRYRSIYLAGATFNLLPDDQAANAALERIAAHLHPKGSVLIPLFKPQIPTASVIGHVTEHMTNEGALMRVTVLDIVRDEAARDQFTNLLYERIDGDDHEAIERSWHLHWFDQDHFAAMATRAGLATRSVRGSDSRPATTHDTAFTFILGHESTVNP
jgi:trans-aconitate methyltransferase